MENKYLIIIGTLLIIITILCVGVIVVSNNGGGSNNIGGIDLPLNDEVVLKISSEDKNLTGTARVYEYSDVEQNSNGTWNLSEFGDYYGLWGFDSYQNGAVIDIPITNGEGEYKISNTTKVFMVDSFITGIPTENSTITVDLYVNGAKKYSSTGKSYGFMEGDYQADINFGHKLITMDGNVIPDKDLVPDTEHNKFKNNDF